SAIERGEEFPSLKALTKISEVLDWPLSFFIDPATSEGEPGAYLAEVEAEGPAPVGNLRDGQLRQALQTVVKAGLDGQFGVQQAQLDHVVSELRARLRELEQRVAALEAPAEPPVADVTTLPALPAN
ncbi:MAG TPA: hypothetical protein VEI97_14980, partial [bacterium]|nr:hypothetical protein [bacterium]